MLGCPFSAARPQIGAGGATTHRPWPQPSGATVELLGVHPTRIDMFSTDRMQAEAPGLHCAWYAEVLMKLTAER